MNETTSLSTEQRFRFTLRSLFIALSLASAAAWLFLRYNGAAGLLFAAAMLLAAWCILRANRVGAAGCLVVFAVAWVALQFFGPYTTLRNRAVWAVGTDRLQQWAVGVLDDPPAGADGIASLDPNSLPEGIRSVAGSRIEVYVAEGESESRVSLRHGGGFHYWGIYVGRPGFTPLYPDQYDKIADGIWGFQGGA